MNWYPVSVERLRAWGKRPFAAYCYFCGLWDMAFDLGGLPAEMGKAATLVGLDRRQIAQCWDAFVECCEVLENGRLMPRAILEAQAKMQAQAQHKQAAGRVGGLMKAHTQSERKKAASYSKANSLRLAEPENTSQTQVEHKLSISQTQVERNSEAVLNGINNLELAAADGLNIHDINKYTCINQEERKEGARVGADQAYTPEGEYISDALNEIFPGEKTNWPRMRELISYVLDCNGTHGHVKYWPTWLRQRWPARIPNWLEFKATFHLMMSEGLEPAAWLNGSIGARFVAIATGCKIDAPVDAKTANQIVSTGHWLDAHVPYTSKEDWINHGLKPDNFLRYWSELHPGLSSNPRPESVLKTWDGFLAWAEAHAQQQAQSSTQSQAQAQPETIH